MPTPNNSIEIFDSQGDIFPSTSANNVKTTDFDFFFNNREVFPYLLQPAVSAGEPPVIPGIAPRRRIFFID